MNLLLIGADDAKAHAYQRAAEYLSHAHSVARLDSSARLKTDARPSADAPAVIALQPLDDQLLNFLIETGASAIYDPPVFDSAGRLREILAVIERHTLSLLPMMPLRLLPITLRIHVLVAEGTLGKLLYLKLSCNERWLADGEQPSALAKRGPAAFDLLRWLLGGPIADVHISRGPLAGNADGITILSFLLANDVYATADISWSLPPGYPKPAAINFEIAGTAGSIRSDVLSQTAQLTTLASSHSLNWGSDWHVEALRALKAMTAGEAPPYAFADLVWAQAQAESLA